MSLMDPKWKYIPASRTDVAATFARIRRELKAAESLKQEAPKVRAIRQPATRKGAA